MSDLFSFEHASFEESSKVTDKKRHLCKFGNCGKTFAHYSKHHCESIPPKKDLTTKIDYDIHSDRESIVFDNSLTVNLVSGRSNDAVVKQTHKIEASPQEAIKLSQSHLNSETSETTVALIKRSPIVQGNALEMS